MIAAKLSFGRSCRHSAWTISHPIDLRLSLSVTTSNLVLGPVVRDTGIRGIGLMPALMPWKPSTCIMPLSEFVPIPL